MNTNKKKTVIDTITIYCIKKISNLFWEIADVWSYKDNKIAQHYNKSIEKEYQKECKTYGLASNSNVLHIGCGAYPLTDMVYSQNCGATLIGIDKNPITVKRAQETIRNHHLEDRITIQHGNGTEYPIKKFDLILVSSCSLPKIQILEHLFKEAKHNSTIIVREVRIATADILNCIKKHSEIQILQQMHHTPFPFYGPLGWDTFYLRKN